MICQTLHNVLGDENKESRIRVIRRLCASASLRLCVGQLGGCVWELSPTARLGEGLAALKPTIAILYHAIVIYLVDIITIA